MAVAASVLANFDRENAGQCGSCFSGGDRRDGRGDTRAARQDGDHRGRGLDRWSVVLRGRGACATLDAATKHRRQSAGEIPRRTSPGIWRATAELWHNRFTAERPFEVVWVEAG